MSITKTIRQLNDELSKAKREYEAAEAVLAVVFAAHGPGSHQEMSAQELCSSKFEILEAAHKAIGEAKGRKDS